MARMTLERLRLIDALAAQPDSFQPEELAALFAGSNITASTGAGNRGGDGGTATIGTLSADNTGSGAASITATLEGGSGGGGEGGADGGDGQDATLIDAGTITSNGGPDGNRFVGILLDRLEDFLEPDGRALIYVFQLVSDAAPLVVDLLDSIATFRSVEVTPSQQQQIPFDSFVSAYSQLFPDAAAKVEHWRAALVRRHGDGLGLCHYVVDIGPRTGAPGPCVIRDDFAEKFGEDFLVPAANTSELAIGRVFENFVPDTAANRKSEP